MTIPQKTAHTELMKFTYKLTGVLALSLAFSFAFSLAFSACGTTRTKKEIFVVDMDTPKIEIGEIEAQFDRLFSIGGLRKARVVVSYFPQEDAVCLRYMSDLITYYQFWSRDGRAAFTNALAQYNEDYEARKLDRNGWKSLKKYNTVEGYLIWQLHRFSLKAMANMNVELGYYFKDRSPYFTVNQREAEFISPISNSDNRTSQTITIFFTRAQAEELSALFDPLYLRELTTPEAKPNVDSKNVDRDVY